MQRLFFVLLIICSHFCQLLKASDQLDPINIDKPIFVSLGSWCDIAINLRKNGMRHAAFPFDWIASVDCERFLEIFQTDFKYFLDDEYLFIKDSHIFNNYYNLEFPHDIFFHPEEPEEYISFKKKYTKRINRFRELENYKGKVYFIRSAFGYSNHPERHFKCEENVSISIEYSQRLYDALQKRFPQLDFALIICDLGKPPIRVSENLIHLQTIPDRDAIDLLFPPK